MTFLSDLLKINEGFSPDFDSMSDDELKQLCVELDATDLCQLDDEGNILNREELIRDLEAGHGDVDPSPMESVKHDLAKKERKATSPYVNVVHDVSNLYSKPVHAVKETAPTVKFHQMADGNKPVALPAYGGKQGDVKNKSAKQAVEDKIGSAGTKGMKKKDRPYMVKPRFRDWLTANMYFNMTKSGELAGKMKLEAHYRDPKHQDKLWAPQKRDASEYGSAGYAKKPVGDLADQREDPLRRRSPNSKWPLTHGPRKGKMSRLSIRQLKHQIRTREEDQEESGQNKYEVFGYYESRQDGKNFRRVFTASSPEEAKEMALRKLHGMASHKSNRISRKSIRIKGVERISNENT